MSLDLKSKNLLYVEYMKIIKNENVEIFKNMFNKIFLSNNGLDALNIFENNHIDYVITDICLPKMNGIELTKAIRELNQEIPIIIHSLYTSQKNFIAAIEYSVNSFVVKEKSTRKLLEAIQKVHMQNRTTDTIVLNNGFIWNINTKQLSNSSETLKLTKNESRLLELLITNKISTSEVIQDFVYNDLTYNKKRVNNLVSRLNLKLQNKLVESVYGFGYKIKS